MHFARISILLFISVLLFSGSPANQSSLDMSEEDYMEEARWHYELALENLNKKDGDIKEAERTLREIVDYYDPYHVEALEKLSALYEKLGDQDGLKDARQRLALAKIAKVAAEDEDKASYSQDEKLDQLLLSLGSSDPEKRTEALGGIRQYGASAIEALRKSAKSANQNRAKGSIQLLGELKAREALPEITSVLRSGSPSVKQRAVEALALIGDPAAIPGLIGSLSDGFFSHYESRYTIRDLASGALADNFGKETCSALLSALNDRTKAEYVLLTFSRMKEVPQKAYAAAAAFFSDKDDKIRLAAVKCFAAKPYEEESYRSMLPLASDGLPEIRALAVKTLSASRDRKAADLFVEKLADPDRSVVKEAVVALGLAGCADVTNILIDIAADRTRDVPVRWYAIQALGKRYGKEGGEVLSRLLSDSNEWISSAAAAALDLNAPELKEGGERLFNEKSDKLDRLALRFTLDSGKAFEESRKASLRKALEYLVKQQGSDGHFKSAYFPLGATELALLCFTKEGEERYAPIIEKGTQYILKNQREDGSFISLFGSDKEKGSISYTTAMAIRALAATKDPGFIEPVRKAVEFLRSIQNEDGRFGYFKGNRSDMSATETAFYGLDAGYFFLKRQKNDETWMKLSNYLKDAQNTDGGFGYTDEEEKERRSYGSMTAAGLICQMLCGKDTATEEVKGSTGWLKKNYTLEKNPFAPSGKHYPFYLYDLGIALHMAGIKSIIDEKGAPRRWYQELVEKLIREQKPDGSWAAEWYEPVMATEFYIMILQLEQLDSLLYEAF